MRSVLSLTYTVEILENTSSVFGMADLGVPLDPIDVVLWSGNCFHGTDGGVRENRESFGRPVHFIGVGSPHTYPIGISVQYLVMLIDLDLHQTIPTGPPRMDRPSPRQSNYLDAQTDPEDRQSEIEIPGTLPGTFHGRTSAENDSPAFPGDLLRSGLIGDQFCRYTEVTKSTCDQVIELTEIIDHVQRLHH